MQKLLTPAHCRYILNIQGGRLLYNYYGGDKHYVQKANGLYSCCMFLCRKSDSDCRFFCRFKEICVIPKNTICLKGVKSKKVKWSSSNKKIAIVKKGVIKAKKKGTCTVWARYLGKKYGCSIRVKDQKRSTSTPAPSPTVTPTPTSTPALTHQGQTTACYQWGFSGYEGGFLLANQ